MSALKDLFGTAALKRLSDAIEPVYPAFDRKSFLALIKKLEKLEMKPRVQMIREELQRQLPQDFPRAVKIILDSVADKKRLKKLETFDLWPYTDFVQTYGLEHLKVSLDALSVLTQLFTGEFAVRPFLIHSPKETLRYLEKCAKDENVHLRRWASEGTRPRLPWGERLHAFIKDPEQALPILDRLKFDPELYVRKSVSNHLNDIAKDHPKKVMEILDRWKKIASAEKNGERRAEYLARIEWTIHRALRTLIKKGNPEALKLIGVSHQAKLKLSGFKLARKTYELGDRMCFEFKIHSEAKEPQKLVIDYIIHFMKSNQSQSPKVFKLKNVTLHPGETLLIQKNHHLKEVTTRTHHLGLHWLEIQVNGVILHKVKWDLV